MHGRPLTFASLLLAAAAPAFAGEPPLEPTPQSATNQPEAATVGGKWSTEVKDGKLLATLTLVNTGKEPVDVMIARGKQPGPSVQAQIAGVSLAPVFSAIDEQAMMSRRGPMPVYAVAQPNQELLVGTYQFQLPATYAGEPIDITAHVGTQIGASVRLETKHAAKPGA